MTSVRCGVLALALACVSPLVVPSAAHADPTAEDLASARDLYRQGRALREKGDLPKALEKLRAAHALGQTPITGFELARTYVLVGRLVDAYEVSLGVARLPVASDETAKSDAARAEAAKLATALEPRLAKLVVSVKGVPAGDALTVTVDGEAVPAAALGEPRRADPGPHVAVLTFEAGREVRAQAVLKEGESREVVLDATQVTRAPAPQEVSVAPLDTNRAAAPAAGHRSPLLLLTGVTVAGFGALFGASFGVAALKAKSSLDADCPGGRCGPDHHGELASAQIDANASTVSFVVAGVGVAAVILELAWRSKTENHAQVVPELGPGWVGLHGAF